MQVGLALEIDSAISHLSSAVIEIDKHLGTCFADKNYGADVENIFIGVILTGPGSEKLHPVRKLKYRKTVKVKIPEHAIEAKNVVEYDVKPDYASVSRLNLEQARRYIAQFLIDSTQPLEQQRSKFPDFDVPRFRQDFQLCVAQLA